MNATDYVCPFGKSNTELSVILGTQNLTAVFYGDGEVELASHMMFAVVIDGKPFAGTCKNELYSFYNCIANLTQSDPLTLRDIYVNACHDFNLTDTSIWDLSLCYPDMQALVAATKEMSARYFEETSEMLVKDC